MFQFGVPTLVIRTFNINDGTGDGPTIEIVGRAAGFTQWLLTLMKVSTLTTFRLHGDELSVVSSGLKGETHTVIPVSAIESTQCGYSKSIGWAALAAFVFLAGLVSMEIQNVVLGLIFGAVFFALYYFSSRMFISVAAGSRTEIIQYKKGLVDGVQVDLERTLAAIGAVNSAVLQRVGN